MSRKIRSLLIFLIIVSVVHLIGGIIYFSATIKESTKYAKADVTIISINEETQDSELIISYLTVKYLDSEIYSGEVTLTELPSRFELNDTITIRYEKSNPQNVYLSNVDWFTPSVVLFIGILYSGISIALIVFNKKTSVYLDSSELE